MFYIIESQYVGPNADQDDYVDLHTIEISTVPTRIDGNGKICLNGLFSDSGDFELYAHGRYATIEEARAAVRRIFGNVRIRDLGGYPFKPEHKGSVEAYKPQYVPLSRDQTIDWCYESVKDDVTADTTDARIDELVDEYEAEANRDGYTLHRDALRRFMRAHRHADRVAE